MVAVARHGHAQRGKTSREYKVWSAMIQRCHNPKNPFYRWYGGRGITVCADWRGKRGFDRFIAHMGNRPTDDHTIERKDNSRGYEPGNVQWATRAAQSRNTTQNRVITIGGDALCVSDWAARLGVRRGMIFNRLSRGWSPEAAVLSPSRK